MLSEQKFKKYWDADSSYFTRDNVWQFFKPYLQQPFDRVATTRILFRYARKVKKPELDGLAETLDELENLHDGESEPIPLMAEPLESTTMTRGLKSDKELYDGEPIKRRFSFEEVKEILYRKKPVCATCGGSGRLPCEDCSGRQVHCEHTFTQKTCPACKSEHCPDCDWDVDEVEGSEDMLVKACKKHECQTCGGSGEVYPHKHKVHCAESGCSKIPCPACKEVRYHRSGQGMHLDERGEQRREKAGVFYKDSNLVWIGHRGGVLGSLYVIDSRVSDRRKGD